MPAHGSRQHYLLQIAAFLEQVIEGIAVGNSNHILLDDGAIVEDFRNVMTGRADQLHTTRKRLMIRFGTNKCRQKRVVNINDSLWILVDELVRKNLHVSRQHNEIRRMVSEQA